MPQICSFSYHRAMRIGDFEFRRIDKSTSSAVGYFGTDERVMIPASESGRSVTAISSGFIRKGSKARKIVIPKTVNEIEDGAFFNGKNIESVEVEKGNKSYKAEDGVLYDSSFYSIIFYPPKKMDEEYIAEHRIGKAAASAFPFPAAIKRFGVTERMEEFGVLPSSLPSLEEFVFTGDDSKKGAHVEDGVLYRGKSLLAYPWKREGASYMIENGTEKIECSELPPSLKKIFVPKSVESGLERILGNAEYVDVDKSNRAYRSIDGVLFSWNGDILRYPGKKKGEIYVTPLGMKKIAREAFASSVLKTLVINGGCTEIAEDAFLDSSLSYLVIPDSVTAISVHAFHGAASLKEIHVQKGSIAEIFLRGEGLGHLLKVSERLF